MPPKSYIDDEEVENIIIIPPDGGWGWVVVLVAFLNNFVIDGIGYTYGLYIEVISEEFKIGIADTAMIGALMSATSYFCGPFVSALLNKYDTRCVSISGSIVAAAAYVICSFTTQYYVLFVCYGIMLGCGFGMMYVPAIVMPTLYFAKWRALASGIGTTGSGLGTLLVPPIVTPLLNQIGWRHTFHCIICVVLCAGVLTLAYLPLKPHVVSSEEQGKDVFFNSSLRRNTVKFQTDEKKTCCQRCCPYYKNSALPTTSELVNPAKAKVEIDKLTTASRRATNYFGTEPSTTNLFGGRKSMGFVGMRQSRYIATITDFTYKDLCKYNCLVCLYSECCEHDVKPMYRDDIFFNSSIKLIPKYKRTAMRMQKKMEDKTKEKEKNKQRLDKLVDDARKKEEQQELMKSYHMGVTRVTIYQEYIDRPKCRCHLSIIRALSTLLHLELFKSITFLITGMAGLLYILGYMIPFMYVVDRAKKEGIEEGITFWFLAVIGGANTMGRLMSGVLPSVFTLNIIVLTWVPAFICGINTIFSGWYMEPWFQFMSGAIFGFFGAFLPALRPVVIVELFGLENLTNVFGLQLLLSGIAAFFGPTIAGILFDKTRSYDYSFYLSGGCIILSGSMYIFIRKIRSWEVGEESDDDDDYDNVGPSKK